MDKLELLDKIGRSELLDFLGVTIEVAEPERVVLKMEVTPRVHQYVGIMNGGVSLFLAETAASIGVVAGSDLTKVTPVGIEINANHLRAVSKGVITVEAKPVYP
ncbi:MAG: PaaI family thioesterase, partial [Pyrinomonadaceae bacterium]